jgi:hypothetical protein
VRIEGDGERKAGRHIDAPIAYGDAAAERHAVSRFLGPQAAHPLLAPRGGVEGANAMFGIQKVNASSRDHGWSRDAHALAGAGAEREPFGHRQGARSSQMHRSVGCESAGLGPVGCFKGRRHGDGAPGKARIGRKLLFESEDGDAALLRRLF